MTKFSLKARWVLPIDGAPLEGAVVTIDSGRIVAVDDPTTSTGTVEDLGDVVLLPGLVNAHTHLEFSAFHQPLGSPGMPLADWIRLVIAERRRSDRDALVSTAAGLEESLASGVTTIGEISTAPVATVEPMPQVLAFQEVIGFSAGRVDSAFADVMERVGANPTFGLSPHAPYTVHPRLLERLVEEATTQGLPVAMHLAESREELELLAHGTGPLRELLEERSMWDPRAIVPGTVPLDYLRTLARVPRAIVVHGNYLSPMEIDFLAGKRDRMSVIYCPRTHAYFQHVDYPLREMLTAGVSMALGTDSRASNPDLSLLSEMRFIAQSHRLPPHKIIKMATLSGAEALGVADCIGSLSPGKWANLIALSCDTRDPAEAVLQEGTSPIRIWLRGCEV